MQQLQVEFKNVPRNTSLVPCSTNPVLNREETLSIQDKVLACNNPEVNLPVYDRSSGTDPKGYLL
jgi:hypothetical protein